MVMRLKQEPSNFTQLRSGGEIVRFEVSLYSSLNSITPVRYIMEPSTSVNKNWKQENTFLWSGGC